LSGEGIGLKYHIKFIYIRLDYGIN